jgi:hypothetical protein
MHDYGSLISYLPPDILEIMKYLTFTYRTLFACALLMAFLTIAGCKGHSDNPADPVDMGVSGRGSFTRSPMNLSEFKYATPLGNLNPPGHTLPTDHVYFYWVSPDHRTSGDMDTMRSVFAPGSGTVTWIYGPNAPAVDSKISVKMTNTFSYYLDHVEIGRAHV